MSRRVTSRGVALVELIVVIALLGVVAAVAGLTIHAAPAVPTASPVAAQVADARARALTSGRALTTEVTHDGRRHAVTAYPDGSVVADTLLHVDRTSGRGRRAAR